MENLWGESERRSRTKDGQGLDIGTRWFFTDAADPLAEAETHLTPRMVWPGDTGDFPLSLDRIVVDHWAEGDYTRVAAHYNCPNQTVRTVSEDHRMEYYQLRTTVAASGLAAAIPALGANLATPAVDDFAAKFVGHHVQASAEGTDHVILVRRYRKPLIYSFGVKMESATPGSGDTLVLTAVSAGTLLKVNAFLATKPTVGTLDVIVTRTRVATTVTLANGIQFASTDADNTYKAGTVASGATLIAGDKVNVTLTAAGGFDGAGLKVALEIKKG
jgi:hypothetical protein